MEIAKSLNEYLMLIAGNIYILLQNGLLPCRMMIVSSAALYHLFAKLIAFSSGVKYTGMISLSSETFLAS